MPTTFSIITPSNSLTWLRKAWPSVKAQIEQDWEWVVLVNNHPASETLEVELAEFAAQDPRIKLHQEKLPASVGLLKNRACQLATGLYAVEFDHDDQLSVDCLAELRKGFESPAAPVFVYSDCASIREDGNVHGFNSAYGWEYRQETFLGYEQKELLPAPVHPLPLPHQIATLYFAPNHVRAWRLDVYWDIGGHDKEMSICDDQDLMCRLYSKGAFLHIPKVLYRYVVHETNTWKKNQKEITAKEREVYDKHIQSVALTHARANRLRAIDIGGGIGSPEGWTSVDVQGAKISADLNERWPFEDSTVGAIRAQDVIEHLRSPVHVMNEAYRVLKHGGIFLIEVPSTDGRGAFQDPSHISFWNSNSFWYYTVERTQRYIKHLGVNCRFMVSRLVNHFPSEWHKQHGIVYTKAHLVAVKEGGPRLHGLLEI